MSIPALEALSALSGASGGGFDAYAALAQAGAAGPAVTGTGYVDRAEQSPGASGFAASLAGAVDNLAGSQQRVSELGVAAVSGRLDNVHDYTVAATEAAVALELTAAVRNKAVDAFNEVMRMQV